MAKHNCNICRGSGLVRLPIYRSVVALVADEPLEPQESSRSYACPECASTIPTERLAVVEFHSLVSSQIDDPGFARHAKASAAHQLLDGLFEKGFIRFQRGPTNLDQMSYSLVATIGVVSPNHVASLEERIAVHQETLAAEVATEASNQISHWGSNYSGNEGKISKENAIAFVKSALRAVLAKRAAMKVA